MMTQHTRVRRMGLVTVSAMAVFAASTTLADPPDAGKGKRPSIYDRTADGNEQIKEALAEARREHKRVLLQFGADWCGWCHKLHDLFKEDRQIARELLYEYVLVLIDVDTVDGAQHNADVIERYGHPIKHGLPVLVVLDAEGKQLVTQETGSLEEGDHHHPDRVLAFLNKWQAEPLSADKVLAGAVAEAGQRGKNVFVHFSAPWCGYCHKLDDYLHQKRVSEVFDKAFVTVKIDVDRMTGGKELDAEYRKDRSGGIPFFVVLDKTGRPLADSFDDAGQNVGFPVAPQEIEHFLKVMNAHAGGLTERDLTVLSLGLTGE